MPSKLQKSIGAIFGLLYIARQVADAIGYAEVLKEHMPWLYGIVYSQVGGLGLFVIALILLRSAQNESQTIKDGLKGLTLQADELAKSYKELTEWIKGKQNEFKRRATEARECKDTAALEQITKEENESCVFFTPVENAFFVWPQPLAHSGSALVNALVDETIKHCKKIKDSFIIWKLEPALFQSLPLKPFFEILERVKNEKRTLGHMKAFISTCGKMQDLLDAHANRLRELSSHYDSAT